MNKGKAKYNHLKQKNNKHAITMEASTEETPTVDAPREVVPLVAMAIGSVEIQAEPLMLMNDEEIHQDICLFVALEEKRVTCELAINRRIIKKFNELSASLSEVAGQVEIVRNSIKDLETINGMITVLKTYGVDMMYKHPTTNYRLPLDARLGNLAYSLADSLYRAYQEEQKKLSSSKGWLLVN